MLERETELIKQIIIESTIDGRGAIKLNEVVAASLPRGVKAYMIAEVTTLLEADFKQSQRLAKITESVAHIVTSERSLLRSLAMEYLFQRDEFLKLVEDTVHFLENYLCRPQWTLCEMMFQTEKTISFDALVRKFERIVDYTYFGELVERYARRREWKEISAESFTNLVATIDDAVVKQHSPRELALLTKPLFDFLLFGDPSMHRPIPLGAILLFFEDKKMTAVKEYTDRICHIRNRTQLSMNELISIIEDLYQVQTTVKAEVKESEDEILAPLHHTAQTPPIAEEQPTLADSPTEISQEEIVAMQNDVQPQPTSESVPQPEPDVAFDESHTVAAAEETPTEPNASAPDQTTLGLEAEPFVEPITEMREQEHSPVEVDKLYSTVFNFETQPVEAQANPVINADELIGFAAERKNQRHALFLTFPEQTTSEPPSTPTAMLPDVDSLLTTEQRQKFVKKIFKGSELDYDIFIASFNKTTAWREAQLHLRELYQVNKLDYLSHDVVEFTDAMHSRFEPELNKTR